MRWKLLIITSLVAALFSAGGMRTLAYLTPGIGTSIGATHLGVIARHALVPLVLTTLACIFVYRHTARRRKLQAALTALFTLILTLAALFASPILISF